MKKSYIITAVVIIILSICFPIVLPRFVDTSASCGTDNITAGDLLGYVGALIASIITILGLSWTFSDNRRGIREQGRLDVLPFVGLNVLSKEYKLTFFSNVMDVHAESRAIREMSDEQYYKERRLDTVFFTIDKSGTKATSELTKEQQMLIKNNGTTLKEKKKGVHSLVNRQLIFIPIEMCNIGNGPAVDVRFAFNLKDAKKKRFVVPVTLAVNEKVYVGIYCESDQIQEPREYYLEVYYKDIFGNIYRQKTDLAISKDGKGALATFDTETKQDQISKGELQRLYEMSKEEGGSAS